MHEADPVGDPRLGGSRPSRADEHGADDPDTSQAMIACRVHSSRPYRSQVKQDRSATGLTARPKVASFSLVKGLRMR
jgi:hypothetical protein